MDSISFVLILPYFCQQNVIRECGGLPHLVALLMHPNKGVCIKAAQLLSNLAMNEANQESLKVSNGIRRICQAD